MSPRTATWRPGPTLVSELAQIGANPDVQAFARNPNVTAAQLADTIASLVKSPLNAEAKNFIAMLAENGRVALLPEIGAQFQALKNAQEGAADAQIVQRVRDRRPASWRSWSPRWKRNLAAS